MRLVNRIILVIVLVALIIFGTFGAIYAFAGEGYEQNGLPSFLALPEVAASIQDWLRNFETGSMSSSHVAAAILIGVVGVALLVFELVPRRGRRLRLGKRLWVSREVVEVEAEHVALYDRAVLEAYAKLRPHRLLRTRLGVELVVRRGEDPKEARVRVRELLGEELVKPGEVPVDKIRVRAEAKDPRRAKRRVK